MYDILLINDSFRFQRPYSYGKTSLHAYLVKKGWDVGLIQPDKLATLGCDPARFFGVGSWSEDFWRVVKAASFVKERYPQIPIICGGGHVNVCPSDLEKHADIFDYWVLGEGEVALDEILQGQHQRHTFINRPVQARDIELPAEAHNQIIDGLCLSMSSRGCANDCTFCGGRAMFGGRTRHISVPQYIQHIKDLLAQGMTTLFFMDSSFLNDKRWASDFCNAVIDEQLRFNWMVMVCAEQLREDLIELMKRAGCIAVKVGIESGFSPLLKAMNKKHELSETIKALNLCKQYGLYTHNFLMYGVLDESRESMAATREYHALIKPDSFSLQRYFPLPGTAMFDAAQRRGLLSAFDWSTKKVPELLHTGAMNRDEISQEYDRLWGKKSYWSGPQFASMRFALIFVPVILTLGMLLKFLHLKIVVFILSLKVWPASLRNELQNHRFWLIGRIHIFQCTTMQNWRLVRKQATQERFQAFLLWLMKFEVR